MIIKAFLDPKQKQWLQQHPEEARTQRTELHQQAQYFQQQVNQAEALEYAGRALESAHAAILALQNPNTTSETIADDFIAYGALTVYLAARYQDIEENAAAQQVYQDSQQQLMALTPLFASEPDMATLIQSIVQGLSPAADPGTQSPTNPDQFH
ncbi:hypothetical protein IT774_16465 [Salinimonas marina]|uniref:Uncharacterized protein n=1 Tax=Salinimonas marina TaxID=2785918 RepID=A0A7S9DXW0_9ALTE|nr:hypothetical protein [Salinimonas marina]QPG05643.1 hypothetical protein IT774_16465 [Salinimonas marina]